MVSPYDAGMGEAPENAANAASDRKASRLATELSNKDPEVGLRAIASLRVLLQSLERLHVSNARAQGWSWQQIAAALGVSRQAVHEKHGRRRRMFGQQ